VKTRCLEKKVKSEGGEEQESPLHFIERGGGGGGRTRDGGVS